MNLNGLEKYFKTDKNGEIINFNQTVKNKTPLELAIDEFNKYNLSENQLIYLLKKTDINKLNQYNQNIYSSFLINFDIQKSQHGKVIFNYIIKNINLEHETDNKVTVLNTLCFISPKDNLIDFDNFNYIIKNSPFIKKIGDLSLLEGIGHYINFISNDNFEKLNHYLINNISDEIKEEIKHLLLLKWSNLLSNPLFDLKFFDDLFKNFSFDINDNNINPHIICSYKKIQSEIANNNLLNKIDLKENKNTIKKI